MLIAHATRQPPLLRDVAPTVPAALASVIDRCLLKRPDDRFATGEELADALGKAMGAVESHEREGQGNTILSSDDAMAIWRRAAELQAQAAARLESRMREATETRKLVAVNGAANGGSAGASSSAAADARAAEPASVPTDAYRLRDVAAAAMEVGISQRYVALALAELQSSPTAMQRGQPVPQWKDRLATRLLGTAQRTLPVSRVFRFPPRVVLQAVGRSFQAAPYLLSLRDTLGGHPLDGGVLVFDLPQMGSADYRWSWTRYGVYVPEVRVTFATIAGDPSACEVTMHLDLRRGLTANLAGYGILSGGGSGVGGVVGGLVGAKALALTGAALLGPAWAGAVAVGLATVACMGPIYRWEIGKTTGELEAVLAAVEASIRAFDIFGEAPPTRAAQPPSMSYLTGM